MVRDRGIITSAYLALRVSVGVSPEFGFQFLNVWDTSKAIYGYGSGLRQNLDHGEIKRLPVFLPPPDEQAAIVSFLGHANARIESYLRAKKKELTLISEMLQSVTQHAMQLPGAKSLRLCVAADVMSRPIERVGGHRYTPIGLYNRGRGIFHKASTDGAHLGELRAPCLRTRSGQVLFPPARKQSHS